MKEIVVKAVKGNSVIFCDVYATDELGHKTEDGKKAVNWSCSLGGACGHHTHNSRLEAERELQMRIGELVLRGYSVNLVNEGCNND